MRAGQALSGVDLRALMALLMLKNALEKRFLVGKRIVDRGDGLIGERQPFLTAGKFGMIFRCRFGKLFEITRAIGHDDGPHLRHAQAEFRQRLQQRRHFVPVLQDPALAVEQLRIFRQCAGVVRPQLAQCRIDELSPGGGTALEHLKLLRTE